MLTGHVAVLSSRDSASVPLTSDATKDVPTKEMVSLHTEGTVCWSWEDLQPLQEK